MTPVGTSLGKDSAALLLDRLLQDKATNLVAVHEMIDGNSGGNIGGNIGGNVGGNEEVPMSPMSPMPVIGGGEGKEGDVVHDLYIEFVNSQV